MIRLRETGKALSLLLAFLVAFLSWEVNQGQVNFGRGIADVHSMSPDRAAIAATSHLSDMILRSQEHPVSGKVDNHGGWAGDGSAEFRPPVFCLLLVLRCPFILAGSRARRALASYRPRAPPFPV
ncbi:hypothetical protein TM49_17240 [Martelella endophytica]|uniref:Uncharacterized protein n=1 Tax=Martelella endophytica TaxID=1486262 RepID=A0A0D5LTE2_MAREN|nr:hypothetical protein TM49_17240 [Martelella endophytica]